MADAGRHPWTMAELDVLQDALNDYIRGVGYLSDSMDRETAAKLYGARRLLAEFAARAADLEDLSAEFSAALDSQDTKEH